MITPKTVIEVERFDGNIFSKNITVPWDGITLELNKIMAYTTVANNIFIVGEDGSFLTDDDIQTIVIDPELGEVEVNLQTSVFIISPKCKLKLIPRDGNGRNVILCSNDVTFQYLARESGLDFFNNQEDYITLNPYKYVTKVKQNIGSRLRIFTESGRLITKRSYNIYKYDNYFDVPRFNIPINKTMDRFFRVCYIGYDERLIYHRDNVPANGLIDLDGKITRPVSLVYHDIYLDGYRLTKYDVDIIAPFSFIIKKETLERIDSLSNIEIYEKTYIPDDFVKFDYGAKSDYIMDKLFEEDTEFYEEIISKLDNIEPTGTTEDVDAIRDWFYDFFHEYIPYHFINADYRYDLEAYHHVFSGNSRILLNADDRIRYGTETNFYFNHDESIRLYDDKIPKWDKELNSDMIVPDDDIMIPEEEYRQNGYYTDPSYDHVYDIPFKFVPESQEHSQDAENSVDHDGNGPTHDPKDLSSKDVDVPRYKVQKSRSANSIYE